MMRLPLPGRRTRLIALAYGMALFLWLSVEDDAVWPVTGFGLGLASLIIVLTLLDKLGGRVISVRRIPLAGMLLGALIGLATSLITAGLMFFKNAVHAHIFPDYPPGLMLSMIERAPVWSLAGGLLGLGLAWVWLALPKESNAEREDA